MGSSSIDRRQMLAVLAGAALSAGTVTMLGVRRVAFAAEGRVLRVQNDGDIRNIDPANRNGWYDETTMFAIFSGLCQYKSGASWEWQLDAAEELNQVDPTTIEFKLKPGIQWTGGFGELTAEDVRYSYERFFDPRVDAVYKTDWEALEKVEVTGTYTGVIRLKQAFPSLFTSTLPHASGLIVCKAAVEKAGGVITTDPLATSGPYRLAEWVPRERIILVRNDLWTGAEPYYDEIQLLPIPDEKTAQIAYEAGDLDITKVNISAIAQLQAAKDPDTTLTVRPALAYTWMGMNVEHPKLADVRVRRAIQHAIDVPAVLDATFGGAVTRAFGVVPPPLAGARDRVLYGHDPKAAKRLLDEAGVKGLQLRLDFSQNTDHATAAQVMQAQLAAVGIALEINQMDGSALVAQAQDLKGGTWRDMQLFFATFTTAPDPGWVTTWFTCDQIGAWNWQHTCDASWEELNKAAGLEMDPGKRATMYVKLQDMLEETGAYVFLYHGLNPWISRSSIKGSWTPDGHWALLRGITAA